MGPKEKEVFLTLETFFAVPQKRQRNNRWHHHFLLLLMRIALLLCLFLLQAFFAPLKAQNWNTTVPKEIVILHSSKDYKAVLKTAREAAKRLGRKLDLGANNSNAKLGLSMSKSDCAGNGYDYPCYTARGDGNADNSDYISIEFSNAYEGFRPGYYIVVAAIGEPGSAAVRNTLAASQKIYPDAYAKQTRVWFGCMH